VTDLRQALRDAVADPPYDDLDLRAVLTEATRRKARRQRWLAGGVLAATATVVLAVIVGTALVAERDAPEPAPAPVEHVDGLLLEDASAFPSQPTHTHHARTPSDPDMYGINTDELVGLTDDGLVVRVRHVYRRGSTVAFVDPVTGATEWLPEPGFGLGSLTALSLESERLFFIDNPLFANSLIVFNRVTESWAKHPIKVREGSQRMYPRGTTMTLAPDGRLWFVAYPAPSKTHPTCPGADTDPFCSHQWWSVPFPDGGQARREPDADRTWRVWSGETLATSSSDGLTISKSGEDISVPLGVPEGCTVPTGHVQTVHSADPLVVTIGCADGTSAVTVYDNAGDPLFSVTGSPSVTAIGEGFVGLTRVNPDGAPDTAYLLDVADRRLYHLPGAGRSIITDIAGERVLWQDPEADWIAPRGHDYWVASLP
jgi:hypothetical protein